MESLNHETKRKTQAQMGGQHHTGLGQMKIKNWITCVQNRARTMKFFTVWLRATTL